MDRMDLRYGLMAGIHYEIVGERLPRQLDLLDVWFPELFVVEDAAPAVAVHDDGRNILCQSVHDIGWTGSSV